MRDEGLSFSIDASDARWEVMRDHVEAALSACVDSSPGPDGIPYAAWRRIRDLTMDVLFEVAALMQTHDCLDVLPCDFNSAFL